MANGDPLGFDTPERLLGQRAFFEPEAAPMAEPFAEPGVLEVQPVALVPPAPQPFTARPIEAEPFQAPALLPFPAEQEPQPVAAVPFERDEPPARAVAAADGAAAAPIPPVPARDPLAVDVELTDNLVALDALGQERTVLRRAAQDQQVEIALAPTPEAADEARARQQETLDALGMNQRQTQRAREDAELARREQDAHLALEANQLRQDATARLRQDLAIQRDAQAVKDADLVAKTGQAVARIAEAKQGYQQELRRGPKTDAVAAVLEMSAEALRAQNERRPVNFEPILARLEKQSEGLWQSRLQAALSEVEVGDDAVADIGRQRDEARLQALALRQATIDDALGIVEDRIARAQSDVERQQLAGLRDALEQEREAKAAQSEALAAEKARKAAREDAETALTRARTAEVQAKTAEAARKAQLRGRGGGRKKLDEQAALAGIRPELRALAATGPGGRKEAERIEKQAVFDPFTGDLIRRTDGSVFVAPSQKEAEEMRALGADTRRVNNLIEEALALRGRFGFEFTREGLATAEGKKMQSIAAQLLVALNKQGGLGALDQGSQDILEQIKGGDLTGIDDPTPALRKTQTAAASRYNEKLSSIGFKGAVAVPITEARPEPTLEEASFVLDRAVSPDGLDVLDPETYLTKVDEERTILVRDSGRSADTRFGEAPAVEGVRARALGLRQSIERNEQRVKELGTKVGPAGQEREGEMGRIDRLAREAQAAGDEERAKKLRTNFEKLKKLRAELDRKITSDKKKLEEFDVRGATRRDEAAERFKKLEEAGIGDAF